MIPTADLEASRALLAPETLEEDHVIAASTDARTNAASVTPESAAERWAETAARLMNGEY